MKHKEKERTKSFFDFFDKLNNKKSTSTHFTIHFVIISSIVLLLLSNNDELVQDTYVNCNKMVFSL